ncbi:MAG: HNH endonuclease [Armatimonadetes bacterium]|nr:HNH endonuclease [Armatimonadota bacterium]
MASGQKGITAQERFRVVLTSSRIKKGLLAISRRFQPLFPSVAQRITVFFDDDMTPHQKPYTPYESTTRECRIYSLRRWFRKHRASEGDWVEIVKEGTGYRLIFHSQEEIRFQRELQAAKTENQAEEALRRLAHRRRLSQRATALKELARLAQQIQRRKRVPVAPRERYEGVPVGLRMLLKTIYGGRCQICGFTFRKRNGEPYFEVHHVDPDAGHHPQNLLVLCANCHAQMEHANVEVKRNEQGWVIAVIINGKERPVYQALLTKSRRTAILAIPAFPFLWWAYSALVGVKQLLT